MSAQIIDVAVIGSGSTGIATAYYLARRHGKTNVALIDCGQPMAFTSAQSGENYRNWWPHPTMVAFTNHSIDLLEEIALESDNRINMNRRGYALVTRETDIDELLIQLHDGLGDKASHLIRMHDKGSAAHYHAPVLADWQNAPAGVDILRQQSLIQRTFPSYAKDVKTVVHIRRGGDISGQQLGMHMLEYLKTQGAQRINGTVEAIKWGEPYSLNIRGADNSSHVVYAHKLINAAGPFAGTIAEMLGTTLPVHNTFQQKIAFEDRQAAIPRNMPFSIDLDSQLIDWLDDERDMLLEEPEYRWLAEKMPGAIHCRPDGGDNGSWIKLGWAYNQKPAIASWEPPLDDNFPDVVLRGAARLNPTLKVYYGQLPRGLHHYGGWYTLTDENWPLIGPMDVEGKLEGAYMNCAMSGFGTMAACAGGELCAAWVAGAELPDYADEFSLNRYKNESLMLRLQSISKGIL